VKKTLFPGYQPDHERLVCIDSDGCAFDTMELKHKECFCPATIQAWGLQAISKYAREAWEYCNLYSRDRGRSRFYEILLVMDFLKEREEVQEYGFALPDITPLRHWVHTAPLLNNEELARHGDDPIMRQALHWSLEMNRRVEEMVKGVPPFPGVEESLRQLKGKADIAVVSATPREALEREWAEHDLIGQVKIICAQEDGSKKECIAALAPHYEKDKVLMIGDAPGDQEAASENGALFYPIIPGEEIKSWKRFSKYGVFQFLAGTYAGEAQAQAIAAFDESLNHAPPWIK
jgi:phosphoglycolate phosphatase-like HAD superfamily hydrolase